MHHIDAHPERIRWYEIHRWLNPFAKQRAVMVTPLTPQEIEAALRPNLWSYTWRSQLNGALKPWGFTLRRAIFGQPCLTVRYLPGPDGTRLEMDYARTAWGIAGWFWALMFWPYVIVRFLRAVATEGTSFIEVGELWPEQSVSMLFLAGFGIFSIATTLVGAFRGRHDLLFYQSTLADMIDARKLSGR